MLWHSIGFFKQRFFIVFLHLLHKLICNDYMSSLAFTLYEMKIVLNKQFQNRHNYNMSQHLYVQLIQALRKPNMRHWAQNSHIKRQHFEQLTHRAWGAVVHLPDLIENHILDENSNGLQDEWHKQMHVDVVPCAVKLPGKKRKEIWE